jgi:hypothetical protein
VVEEEGCVEEEKEGVVLVVVFSGCFCFRGHFGGWML